jgi:hypothetical protein
MGLVIKRLKELLQFAGAILDDPAAILGSYFSEEGY